jgi:RNA polymerase sigma factor (sigma-70 family)
MPPPNKPVREVMLAAVPSLRAFAISLCGNVDRADDLVQEALLRALANLDSFEPGTNMSAWLFTILRNLFRSEYRKRRREVEDADGSYAESLTSLPDQSSHLEMDEFRRALELLPTDQRESLILVGPPGSPTRKPRKSAAAPSAPSKAGSTAPAADWRRSSRSRAQMISVPIMRPVRWWEPAPVPGDGRRRRGTRRHSSAEAIAERHAPSTGARVCGSCARPTTFPCAAASTSPRAL